MAPALLPSPLAGFQTLRIMPHHEDCDGLSAGKDDVPLSSLSVSGWTSSLGLYVSLEERNIAALFQASNNVSLSRPSFGPEEGTLAPLDIGTFLTLMSSSLSSVHSPPSSPPSVPPSTFPVFLLSPLRTRRNLPTDLVYSRPTVHQDDHGRSSTAV